MTPLYNMLNRRLPAKLTNFVMVMIYAALIVTIVNFLVSPAAFELVYLDLGR